jgi:hypothetical protein
MKLHELLAVEGSIKGQATKVRGELSGTFEKKRHLFGGVTKTFTPKDESEDGSVEVESSIQSTVPKELKWISEFLGKAMDSGYQICEANTIARADVVLEDGAVFLASLPATALLELEKRMAELQEFLLTVPTLDPAKGFEIDVAASADGDIFKAREVTRVNTKKIQKPLTLAPATDKHAAQVQLVSEDVPVGKTLHQEWSGMITPARKGEMIARCEELARAIKQARSKANEVEITNRSKIGEKILGRVFAV